MLEIGKLRNLRGEVEKEADVPYAKNWRIIL
jgi:hypothetical protein